MNNMNILRNSRYPNRECKELSLFNSQTYTLYDNNLGKILLSTIGYFGMTHSCANGKTFKKMKVNPENTILSSSKFIYFEGWRSIPHMTHYRRE